MDLLHGLLIRSKPEAPFGIRTAAGSGLGCPVGRWAGWLTLLPIVYGRRHHSHKPENYALFPAHFTPPHTLSAHPSSSLPNGNTPGRLLWLMGGDKWLSEQERHVGEGPGWYEAISPPSPFQRQPVLPAWPGTAVGRRLPPRLLGNSYTVA